MSEHDLARWWHLCPYRMAKAFGTADIQQWANTSERCSACMHRYATEMPKREKMHLCWARFIEDNTKEGVKPDGAD